MSKIIGIDLGTSNTAAAVMEGGKSTIIPSAEGASIGGKAFPSYVAFTKDEQRLVGEPARRQAIANPEGTATAFKRRMGEGHKFTLRGKEFTPQQLSAFVLQKVKQDAEAFLGDKVEKAVITVPAYFNDNQRQATKDAGKIAGLEVVRLVNEPTAAALAFGIDKAGKEHKILVFDLGGGTLDVTIMEMSKEGAFEVISTSGDTKLGGTDMDDALINWVMDEFKKSEGIDLSKDATVAQRLKEACEKAKIELSTTMETDINLPFITADSSGPKHLTMKLSRSKLETLVEDIVKRCDESIDRALNDAKASPNDIDKIILVGGPTRMPIVQKFVENHVGKKIERGIDPMECVAAGAAIQAGIITGDVKDVLLLDVTPLSLGIETLGGVMTKVIEKGTTIPVKKSQVFSTAEDNQPAVSISVCQGEREFAKDNKSLGLFELADIPAAPRGVPQIEVTFDIDANGVLTVSSSDKGTGKSQSITISGSSGLSEEEIEKMIQDAEKNKVEDEKRKELVDLRNQADALVAQTEKTLTEAGDDVEAEEKAKIEAAITDLKDTLKDESATKETIEEKVKALTEVSHKMAEEMYKKKEEGGAEASQSAKKADDDVIDAEIE